MDGGERRRFGRYETLFPIAQGGMAEVWAARALGAAGFQKLVALKRMRPELAADAKFVTMFLDEGRVAANITSPPVVSTLDLGRADDDSLYLVMELVTGASLEQLMREATLRGERLPVGLAVDIVAQAAQGLHAAHEARSPAGEPLEIVHRDCSPHNILVDVHGQVKITDFGIAKAMERQTRSQAGEMKGKLSYLSYEQARGHAVDRRSDIFILGIVAWEVLAGRQLFEARSAVQALHRIVTMEIPRLDQVSDVSADLADAVAQALVRERNERYSTAAAFANALLNAHGVRTPPPSELGALVRRFGGDQLRKVEGGIRESMGGSAVDLMSASEPEYPIPLAAVKSSPPPPRERIRTKPLAALASPPPPAFSTTGYPEGDAKPPFPQTAVQDVNDAVDHPVDDDSPRERAATLPMHGAPAPRVSHATVALPSEPPPSGPLPSEPRLPTPREGARTQPLSTPEAPPWERRPKRSRAGVWVALAALLVIALGGAGGWWVATLGPSDTPSEAPRAATAPEARPETPAPAPAHAVEPVEPVEPVEAATEAGEIEASIDHQPAPRERHPAAKALRPRPPRPRPVGRRPAAIRDEASPRGDREAALDEIPGLGD